MKKVDQVQVKTGNGWSVVTERFETTSPSGLNEICVWPDGTWIMRDDYSEHEWSWAGDDFRVVRVPEHLEEKDIDRLLEEGKL